MHKRSFYLYQATVQWNDSVVQVVRQQLDKNLNDDSQTTKQLSNLFFYTALIVTS